MVYNIFWLVIVYIISSILLLYLKKEFIPLLIILIYVGAIAILFLFTIQMVDNFKKNENLPIIILILLFFTFNKEFNLNEELLLNNNYLIENLGFIFYNYYLLIIILTIFLFISLIGVLFLLVENEN